jgi:hypothetical protein
VEVSSSLTRIDRGDIFTWQSRTVPSRRSGGVGDAATLAITGATAQTTKTPEQQLVTAVRSFQVNERSWPCPFWTTC